MRRPRNAEERIASRYIPKDSISFEEDGLGIVYVYPIIRHDGKNRYGVLAYAGTAGKPTFHYSVRHDVDVDKAVSGFFTNLRGHKKIVEERKRADNAGHSFQVGDIVYNSWGYDQTNVDWYRVTRTTKNYVWLQPVAGTLEQTAYMAGETGIALDDNLKPIDLDRPVERHKAAGPHVSFKHGSGSKYAGGTRYTSWYA